MYDEYDGNTLKELIVELGTVKRELDEANEIKTNLQKRWDHLRIGRIPEAMADEEITNITVEGVGRIHLQADLQISIKAATREEAYEWLNDHGFGDLIIDTVNAGTLKAAAKGWLESGEVEIPPELFNFNPLTRAVLTRTGVI